MTDREDDIDAAKFWADKEAKLADKAAFVALADAVARDIVAQADATPCSVWSPELGGHKVTARELADSMRDDEWQVLLHVHRRRKARWWDVETRDRLKDKKLVSFTWAGGTVPDYASVGINGRAVLETSTGRMMLAATEPSDDPGAQP